MPNFCKILPVIILFFSQSALADEGYQLETTLNHGRYKSDSGYKSSDDSIGATYYFSKVDPGSYPYEEAEFMSRSSAIGIGYAESTLETSLGNKVDPVAFELYASYANPNHPYMISGLVFESTLDATAGVSGSESQSYAVAPGYFLQDNLLLAASFAKHETKYSIGGTHESDSAALLTKWLNVRPSGATYNLIAGVSYRNSESTYFDSSHSTAVFLSGDYYITRALSVGASASVADSSNSDNTTTSYSLTSSWFIPITSHIFAKLWGSKYFQESEDAENISFSLGMRF